MQKLKIIFQIIPIICLILLCLIVFYNEVYLKTATIEHITIQNDEIIQPGQKYNPNKAKVHKKLNEFTIIETITTTDNKKITLKLFYLIYINPNNKDITKNPSLFFMLRKLSPKDLINTIIIDTKFDSHLALRKLKSSAFTGKEFHELSNKVITRVKPYLNFFDIEPIYLNIQIISIQDIKK